MKKEKWHYKNDWISFYPTFDTFAFIFGPASYFDNRWYFHGHITQPIAILATLIGWLCGLGSHSWFFMILFFVPWGQIYAHFPIRSMWDDSDPPEYGVKYHGERLWIHYGGDGNFNGGSKYLAFRMPWYWEWVRTSKLMWHGSNPNPPQPATSSLWEHYWLHETRKNRIDFHKDENIRRLWTRSYPYIYKLNNGDIQERIATINVEEREWRWRWFRWLPIGGKIQRSINVEFDDEVGEETGSWKGGTVGCGYNLLPNESPKECLARMERERKF